MQFREFAPVPALRRVVVRVWTLESDENTATQPEFDWLVPDGKAELVIHLGATPRRQVDGHFEPEPPAFVFGQLTEPLVLSPPAERLTIGASLRPEALGWAAAGSGHELTNRAVALEDLWGQPGLTLRQRLLDAPSTIDRVGLLQRAILARIRDVPFEAEAEAHAVSLVHRRRGALTVRELAARVGMGPRQLQRRFKDTIGVSPKTFIRISRFQAVVSRAVRGHHINWAALATDLGFADQAHMIREFRSFAGEPPVSFAGAKREFAVALAGPPPSGEEVSSAE